MMRFIFKIVEDRRLARPEVQLDASTYLPRDPEKSRPAAEITHSQGKLFGAWLDTHADQEFVDGMIEALAEVHTAPTPPPTPDEEE